MSQKEFLQIWSHLHISIQKRHYFSIQWIST